MTYRELLNLIKTNPNPFWNSEQHNKEVEYRFQNWLQQRKQSAEKTVPKKNK